MLGNAEQQDERQQAETEAQEVPPEYEEEFFIVQVAEHWNWLPREAEEPPSLEFIKNYLDANLCNVFWDEPT